MGHARCLDVSDGKVIWARDLAADFRASVNFWGMSSAPLVIGNRVIYQIGGEPGACVVALDVRTGQERWRALDGKASYSPPRPVRFGDREAVLVWTAQWLAILDANTGTALWKQAYKFSRMVHNVADPVLDETGRRVLLTSFYDGSHYFALDAAASVPALLWSRFGINERKTEAIQPMVTTPFIREGKAYGLDSYGELRCLDLATGDRVWKDVALIENARWATAHFVQNGDRTWVTTEKGEIAITRFTSRGVEIISRSKFITPDTHIRGREEPLAWSHPAYAHRSLFARTDSQLVCVSLATPAP
jgi:outer membrane protein assembly factor BamB